jgi:ferritin
MQLQSKEEIGHGNRFFKYVVERGGKVTLRAISEPKSEYKSPLEAFKVSLGHEQKVSAAICAIYELASGEKDYATLSFLKWFLDEQVEEEKGVGEIITKLELIGDNLNGLFQIDHQAGRRAEEEGKH